MARILIVLVVVLAILWLARSGRGDKPGGGARSKPEPRPEDMVACAHCGVHLPRSEAQSSQGVLFCGEAHRLAYERDDANRR